MGAFFGNWRTSLGGIMLALGTQGLFTGRWAFLNGVLTGIGGLLLGGAAADAKTLASHIAGK